MVQFFCKDPDDCFRGLQRLPHPVAAGKFGNIVAQCYYRDDRVMTSLGMELRAPHPKGYEVATGDWSLLEPVRRRQSFYRPTD